MPKNSQKKKSKRFPELKPTVILPKFEEKKPKPPTDEEIKKAREIQRTIELRKPTKSKPKRIKYTGQYKRQSLVHAQIILLPRHEAGGILTAQASSINLDSTNSIQCRIRFYGGNLIIELSSTNAQMSFATNSVTDMQLLENGIHKVIRKVRKTTEK